MKNRLTKVPPLSGTLQDQINQLKNHQNKLVEELTRVLEEKDAEIDRMKKEIMRSGKS